MSDKIKVVLVDDDSLVSISLKTILEASGNIQVVAVGTDGKESLGLYEEHKPDVFITDIRMKDVTGLEAAEEILYKYPDARILLLTTFNDDEYIVKALNIGAKGYILKQDFAAIAPAVAAVSGGQTVFGGQVMERIPKLCSEGSDEGKMPACFEEYGINDKELDIIKLVSKGYNNKEIADELFLSEGTVRNYLSVILEKLKLRDRTQLAVFYLSGSTLPN